MLFISQNGATMTYKYPFRPKKHIKKEFNEMKFLIDGWDGENAKKPDDGVVKSVKDFFYRMPKDLCLIPINSYIGPDNEVGLIVKDDYYGFLFDISFYRDVNTNRVSCAYYSKLDNDEIGKDHKRPILKWPETVLDFMYSYQDRIKDEMFRNDDNIIALNF